MLSGGRAAIGRQLLPVRNGAGLRASGKADEGEVRQRLNEWFPITSIIASHSRPKPVSVNRPESVWATNPTTVPQGLMVERGFINRYRFSKRSGV